MALAMAVQSSALKARLEQKAEFLDSHKTLHACPCGVQCRFCIRFEANPRLHVWLDASHV
jgi:hypothetical protein